MKIKNLTAGTTVGELEQANARIAELEAQLADLRDFAYNRAPKLAGEVDSAQVAELKARAEAAEKTVAHLRKAKNCYYDCVEKSEANQRIAEAQKVAWDIVRPVVEKAEADAARFLDILRDVWNQFAIERPDGTKWHGGLSTLEDVEAALRTDEQPDCDHPFRVTGETCGACGAKDEQPAAFTFDLVAHLTRQRAFSLKTFGPGIRTKGVIEHIKKELVEIEAKPYDLKEWIDVVILAFDGAWRSGANPEEIARIFESKQTINEGREWPDWRTCDPNNAIEHVRDEQPAAK